MWVVYLRPFVLALIILQGRTTAQKSGKNVTCVWCRAEWVLPDAGKGKGKAIGEEGYVNLAAIAGVSPQRDTSSCKSL